MTAEPTPRPFPVGTLGEAVEYLRRPFTPAAIKFRVLEGRNDRARCAAYIDARLVTERLNMVIPHKWSHAFEPVQGGLRCDLTVDGSTRPDVGWSNGTTTDIDLKALYSDALKRAAVHFGIGVSLYAIPALYVDAGRGEVKVVQREGKKPAYYMTAKGDEYLRKVYAKWLEEHGAKAFGEPLDHGDVERGESDEPPVAEPAPAEPSAPIEPPVSDVPSDTAGFEVVTGHVVPGVETVDSAFAVDLFDVMAAKLATVGQFRSMLEGVGADLPQDLRSREARLGVVAGLSVQQAVQLEKALRVIPEQRAAA